MALQTATRYEYLTHTPTSLHGIRFESLTSVDQTERPPGGGVPPVISGTLDSAGYVLDVVAGTIRRADELAPVWAKLVYEWEDAADPNVAALETEISELAQDLATAIGWLNQIDSAPAPTAVNLATIQQMATAIQRLAIIERRMLKLVARQLAGTPVQ